MTNNCFLDTDGYRLLFKFRRLPDNDLNVELALEFLLDLRLGQVAVKSGPTLMAVRDLERLLDYFEQHVANLQQDADYEAETFVPMDLSFQLQALSGEIRSFDDGEFGLLFLLNVGAGGREGAAVYVGGESVVTVVNVKVFVCAVREVVAGRVKVM